MVVVNDTNFLPAIEAMMKNEAAQKKKLNNPAIALICLTAGALALIAEQALGRKPNEAEISAFEPQCKEMARHLLDNCELPRVPGYPFSKEELRAAYVAWTGN